MEQSIDLPQKKDSILTRFLSLWAVVYVFIFIINSQFFPTLPFMENFIIWFGKTFLHLSHLEKIQNTGSGDTTYDYVFLVVNFICSVIITIAILIADRKRKNYQQLFHFAIVIARYYVSFTMLTYGFAKIFNGQFPPNGLFRLDQNVGSMSPMGMLWTFMGASRAYTFFAGLMEAVGGVLLLFRKTKTFGSLFSMTVMINVAIMNFTYDVPVKIFSTHIVLLCVFILTYEWKKLYRFFILHKTTVLDYNKFTIKKKWALITLRVCKGLLIAAFFYSIISEMWPTLKEEKVPLEGLYTTHSFILDHDTISLGRSNDTLRWDKLLIAYPGSISVVHPPKKYLWYQSTIDTINKTLHLQTRDSLPYASFTYSIKKDTLQLTGEIEKKEANILFTRKQAKDYPLVNRGFHWINEYPPNF